MKNNFKVSTIVPDPTLNDEDSELSLFDQQNPDIGFFNLIDDETIRLSGSKLEYYKFIQTNEYDNVYMEQKNKPILSSPIIVYAHYDPKALEENMTQFGIEITSDQVFTFNKSYIIRKLGRAPIAGDVVSTKFQMVKYQIFEVQEDGFEAYGVYHYSCSAKVLRDTIETVNLNLTKVSDTVGGVTPLLDYER